jgi:uncharacterized protein YjbI with pentapeptide repeats
MIEPQRAPARPRVISLHSGEELLLEDLVRSFLEAGQNRTICLHDADNGTAAALRHLAFVFSGIAEVRVSGPTGPRVVVRGGKGGHALVHCRLAPWGRDDWIEYLLAEHPNRCASVMSRLLCQDEPDLLDGSPSLWRAVLDLMAADDSLTTVREAVLRYVGSLLDDITLLPAVQTACLEAVGFDPIAALKDVQALPKAAFDVVVSHAAIRLLLAGDKIVTDLVAQAECAYLGNRLPRELVREVARLAARLPEAMDHLRQLVTTRHWAMAASLLHATNTGWVPDPQRLPVLANGYFPGAAWPDASLARLVAYGADLTGADLRRADLTGASLMSANLAGACLQRARFAGGSASGANLARADLSFIQAVGASFHSADLRGADLSGARLAETHLESAKLNDACLADADLHGARLAGAELKGAELSGADLTGAKLTGATLKDCRCVGAAFAGADLTGCDLEGLELPAANFTGANLTNALLTGTSMEDGRLDGARLTNAGLADVDWQRVSLRGADLTGASFHLGSSRSGLVGSPIACEGSRTGFYTDDYDEQEFKSPEEIRKANLSFADLRGAVLDKVDFYLVDLRGALLDPEQEEHARRCGAILEARC